MRLVFGSLALAALLSPSAVHATPYDATPGGHATGPVILSERERRNAVLVRLPDGRVVLRPVAQGGLPWLFGFGSRVGKASGLPTRDGSTPSVLKSTPSGGLIPGQNAR